MKNIHILSTDKPSNFLVCIKDYIEHIDTPAENSDKKGNFKLGFGIYTNTEFYQHQNIYITSDKEIKEGDYVLIESDYDRQGLSIKKYNFKDKHYDNCLFKKIILTTDQDLIKDGVQEIPDEFLEWFVKNPSCESVEVELKNFLMPLGGARRWWYEIIIPKEEKLTNICIKCGVDLVEKEGAKFICKDSDCRGIVLSNETLNHFLATSDVTVKDLQKFDYKNTVLPKELLKQEHEEAAENYSRIILNKGGLMSDIQISSFIAGAKWQQERSYSE